MADACDGLDLDLDLDFALDEGTLACHPHLVPLDKDKLNHKKSNEDEDKDDCDLSLFFDNFPYDTTKTESTTTISKSHIQKKIEAKTERRKNHQKHLAILTQIREWGNTDILDEQQYRTWRPLHDHREQMKQAKKTRRAARHGAPRGEQLKEAIQSRRAARRARRAALHGAPRVELHDAPRVELHGAPRDALHDAPRDALHGAPCVELHGAPRVELHGTLRIDIIKHVVRMTCNYFIGFVCRFVVLCRVLCQIANRNDRMNVQNILFMCGFLYKIYRIFLLCKTII